MKPLIVMGMGRSGTRYFADIMNRHADILLHGEIRHTSMAKLFALLDDLDTVNAIDSSRQRSWLGRKGGFIFDAFSGMAMGGGTDKAGHRFIGHKTPRSEKFIYLYEKHFKSAGMVPLYFYCIRNPFDVWASYKNMPWNSYQTVASFIEAYAASYKLYQKTLRTAGTRVQMLNLDAYKRAEVPGLFLKEKVFAHLGLEVDDDFIQSLYQQENRNSSKNVVGKAVEENTDEECAEIRANETVSDILQQHFPWHV